MPTKKKQATRLTLEMFNDRDRRKNEVVEIQDIITEQLGSGMGSKVDGIYQFIYDPYLLAEAFHSLAHRWRTGGIDNMTFNDFYSQEDKAYSCGNVIEFINSTIQDLSESTYKPSPLVRKRISEHGKIRNLGLPTIKDKIIQEVCRTLLEPIFEPCFHDCSYAYRRERSHVKAVIKAKEIILETPRLGCYDLDLRKFFDTIPHSLILGNLRAKVADDKIIDLINEWITAPVYENGELLTSTCGIGQGCVTSPILANIALHTFDEAFYSKESPARKFNAKIVRYSDDISVFTKERFFPDELKEFVDNKLTQMGLIINTDEGKTKTLNLADANTSLCILGFNISIRDKSLKGLKDPTICIKPLTLDKTRRKIDRIIDTYKKVNKENWGKLINELNCLTRNWSSSYGHVCTEMETMTQLNSYMDNKVNKLRKANRLPKNEAGVPEMFLMESTVITKSGKMSKLS